MAVNSIFNVGDWVVHVNHGVGQVSTLEKKSVGNKKNLYYRIEGDDCTFWIPVSNSENERMRPVASRSEMKEAIREMMEQPEEVGENYNDRQRLIKEALSKNSIIQNARLVRDLHHIQYHKRLGITESRILENLEKHLVMEWSVVLNIAPKVARMELRKLLSFEEIVIS